MALCPTLGMGLERRRARALECRVVRSVSLGGCLEPRNGNGDGDSKIKSK